ncbi:MAG: hypothetical protein GQ527_09955 [Bacteroidales bacterium]|nr:hypothetical protein [Bacteroidales bacterium]
MAKRKHKENIYHREKASLERTQAFLESEEEKTVETSINELKEISNNYEELLDQTVLITRISDRLQKKLDQTNDKLLSLNDQLNDKNVELQSTIDDLTKARVGRKATTIVFVFALVLFVFSEALIEPYIESIADNIYLSLSIKAVIAMSIKPLESLVESRMLKSVRKKSSQKIKED